MKKIKRRMRKSEYRNENRIGRYRNAKKEMETKRDIIKDKVMQPDVDNLQARFRSFVTFVCYSCVRFSCFFCWFWEIEKENELLDF